jgi:hypothetical protein
MILCRWEAERRTDGVVRYYREQIRLAFLRNGFFSISVYELGAEHFKALIMRHVLTCSKEPRHSLFLSKQITQTFKLISTRQSFFKSACVHLLLCSRGEHIFVEIPDSSMCSENIDIA